MRKGQGALEYLITYGWAILIIVIIGGALFALGVFNPSNWVSNKRATGFSSIQVTDWLATSSGGSGVTFILQNKFGSDINITEVRVTRSSGDCIANATNGINTTIGQGELSLDGSVTLTTSATFDDCIGTLTTGDSYTMNARFSFTANGIDHVDSGVIVGKLE